MSSGVWRRVCISEEVSYTLASSTLSTQEVSGILGAFWILLGVDSKLLKRRRLLYTSLYGVISRKTWILIDSILIRVSSRIKCVRTMKTRASDSKSRDWQPDSRLIDWLMWLLAVTPLTSHLSPLQLLCCLLNLLRPPLEFLSRISSKTT